MAQKTERLASAPYVPFRTFMSFIGWLREAGVPDQIDRSTWRHKFSGASGAQAMAALRYLGLVSEDEKASEDLDALAKDPEKEKEILRQRLTSTYAPILNGLDLTKASLAQLRERFEKCEGLSGDTVGKALTFFLRAAEYTTIPLSPHVRVRQTSRRGLRKAKTRENTNPSTTGGAGAPPDHSPLPSGDALARKSDLLWGLFKKLPAPGEVWTKGDRTAWIAAVETVFDLEYRES